MYITKIKQKGVKMTRSQRAKSNTLKREREMRKKVIMMTTGMFSDDYRKKNGKFNMTLIAKESGLHRDTVKKHITQLIDEKVLMETTNKKGDYSEL